MGVQPGTYSDIRREHLPLPLHNIHLKVGELGGTTSTWANGRGITLPGMRHKLSHFSIRKDVSSIQQLTLGIRWISPLVLAVGEIATC